MASNIRMHGRSFIRKQLEEMNTGIIKNHTDRFPGVTEESDGNQAV